MITAETFAVRNSGVWREVSPRLENFVRWANTSATRVAKPIEFRSGVEHRGVVAELGYTVFGRIVRGERPRPTRVEIEEVFARLAGLPGGEARPVNLSELLRESEQIGRCLFKAIAGIGVGPVVLRPRFPGCGIVDAAEGDVVVRDCLVEVKTVDRPLRGTDLRQLLVYSALDWAAGRPHGIGSVAMVNPRLGLTYRYGLDVLARDVAGLSAAELMDRLQWWFTSEGASR